METGSSSTWAGSRPAASRRGGCGRAGAGCVPPGGSCLRRIVEMRWQESQNRLGLPGVRPGPGSAGGCGSPRRRRSSTPTTARPWRPGQELEPGQEGRRQGRLQLLGAGLQAAPGGDLVLVLGQEDGLQLVELLLGLAWRVSTSSWRSRASMRSSTSFRGRAAPTCGGAGGRPVPGWRGCTGSSAWLPSARPWRSPRAFCRRQLGGEGLPGSGRWRGPWCSPRASGPGP